jgi:pimeloyl-ACP methyl ester carboxylesterase
MFLIRVSACFILATAALPAASQDYEREKRWSDEVAPGLVVGDAVWIAGLNGRKFLGLLTEATHARAAVLLVHGVGVHPDHGVIGALRTGLADAGYVTLSIQMPVLDAQATPKEYQAVFPDAIARIRSAAGWLRAKSNKRIVLLSHSMGSSMSNAYYEQATDAPFAAWVCMGLGDRFGAMRNVKVPVLDVYGEKDLPSVLRGDWRRRITVDSIPGSRQVMIRQADHFYSGHEKELSAAIDEFIRGRALQ